MVCPGVVAQLIRLATNEPVRRSICLVASCAPASLKAPTCAHCSLASLGGMVLAFGWVATFLGCCRIQHGPADNGGAARPYPWIRWIINEEGLDRSSAFHCFCLISTYWSAMLLELPRRHSMKPGVSVTFCLSNQCRLQLGNSIGRMSSID